MIIIKVNYDRNITPPAIPIQNIVTITDKQTNYISKYLGKSRDSVFGAKIVKNRWDGYVRS